MLLTRFSLETLGLLCGLDGWKHTLQNHDRRRHPLWPHDWILSVGSYVPSPDSNATLITTPRRWWPCCLSLQQSQVSTIDPSLSHTPLSDCCYVRQAFGASMELTLPLTALPRQILLHFWKNKKTILDRSRLRGLQYAFEWNIQDVKLTKQLQQV